METSIHHPTLQQTLRSFRNRLTQNELDDFKLTKLDDVHETLWKIQRRQETQKEMMNMTRMHLFLTAMEQFSTVVETYLKVSDVTAFIWGPLKFLLQVASTWSVSFDKLLEAYEQIGETLPLFLQYQAVFEREPGMLKILVFIYGDILEFHGRALRFFSGKIWRQVFRAMWTDFATRLEGILANLKRHSNLIAVQSARIQLQEHEEDKKEYQVRFANLEQFQQEAKIKLEEAEETRIEEKFIKIVQWIASRPPYQDHEIACETRKEYAKTGLWILNKPKIMHWMNDECPRHPLLWVHGVPGAGKTILASILIEHCLQVKNSGTAYFYCKHDDSTANTCLSILKGLLFQQIQQHRYLVPYFDDVRSKSGEPVLQSVKWAKQVIELLCQRDFRQYLIIDGLDECPLGERRATLSFLNSLVKDVDTKLPGKLRLLVVSQEEPDIFREMTDPDVLPLNASDNSDDISAYVAAWNVKIQEKFDLDDEQVEYIQDKTCIQAQGQFLFAKLVVENLYAQSDQRDLKNELTKSTFPKQLSEAYERIVVRIRKRTSESQWNKARELLGWMVCAARPLKWHEMQGAVSIDVEEEEVNFEERKMRDHIHDVCGSLVKVYNEDRIRLVHSTAKEFITNSSHIYTPAVEYKLAALCLQYLAFRCFHQDLTTTELRDFTNNGYYAFADYAVAKWSYHFCRVAVQAKELVTSGTAIDRDRAIQELIEALDYFHGEYDDDLTASLVHAEEIDEDIKLPEDVGDLFESEDAKGQAQAIWLHVQMDRREEIKTRHQISLPKLDASFRKIREHIETITANTNKRLISEEQEALTTFYGQRRFKCSKMACYYFHEGFKDEKTRRSHVNRHDRPYECEIADCNDGGFGFQSKKDLESHTKSFHPDVELKSRSFPAPPPKAAKFTHTCETCLKKFTRAGILKSHRLTHTGDKPFECSRCGKAFTRKNDCVRHEKIHERR